MFDPVGCHKQQCHSLVTYRARIIPYLRKAYYFKTIFNNLVIIFKKKKQTNIASTPETCKKLIRGAIFHYLEITY